MNKYEPKEFIQKLSKRMPNNIPACPFCHGDQFTSTEDFASIIIGKDISTINLGPSIPAGMLICQTCGHIEFFALGALGLLKNKEEEENG